MSILSELIRERREWAEQRKTVAVRHQYVVRIGEAALGAELFVLICLYREAIDRLLQLLLR